MRNGRTEIQGQRVGNTLYCLNILAKEASSTALAVKETCASLSTWHERFAHLNYKTILKMATLKNASGLNLTEGNTNQAAPCEGCILGKMHRLPFKVGRTRATEPGQLIHSDLCGPMQVTTPSGSRYFAIFKDDFSGWTVTRLLQQTSPLDGCLREFVAQLKGQTGKEVKTIRSDNGGEYFGGELVNWLAELGIRHESSAPHTPQHNGVSERTNRTLMEAARSQMHAKKVPIELWGESIASATYVLNRASTTKSNVTPFANWYGRKPDVTHLRAFGCQAFVHIPDAVRRKLDANAQTGIMVGYCNESKAYRVWNPTTRRIIISRDVIFNEGATPFSMEIDTDYTSIFPLEPEEQSMPERDTPTATTTDAPPPANLPDISVMEEGDINLNDELPLQDHNESNTDNQIPEAVQPRNNTSTSTRTPKVKYTNYKGLMSSSTNFPIESDELQHTEPVEPLSYQQALSSEQAEQWKAAITEEYESLISNKTWELVTLPSDRVTIKSRWLFKIKPGHNNVPERYNYYPINITQTHFKLSTFNTDTKPGLLQKDTHREKALTTATPTLRSSNIQHYELSSVLLLPLTLT